MQTVRILKNKTKVRKLNISQKKIDAITYLKDHIVYIKSRSKNIKDILGHSPCGCGEIPTVELSLNVGDGTVLEYYCENCLSQVYKRAEENLTSKEIAEKYGCVAVDSDDMPKRDIYNTTD